MTKELLDGTKKSKKLFVRKKWLIRPGLQISNHLNFVRSTLKHVRGQPQKLNCLKQGFLTRGKFLLKYKLKQTSAFSIKKVKSIALGKNYTFLIGKGLRMQKKVKNPCLGKSLEKIGERLDDDFKMANKVFWHTIRRLRGKIS